MTAPDRSTEVADYLRLLASSGQVTLPFATDDRRRVVLFKIINYLNVNFDGGKWGALVKNDRTPPFIPTDIIVWQDTREHFDILTDGGPMWGANGVIDNPEWQWQEAPNAGPIPGPVPQPSPTPIPPAPPAHDPMLDEIHADNLQIIDQNNQLLVAMHNIADRLQTLVDKPVAECKFAKYGLSGNTKAFGGALVLRPIEEGK